MPGLGRHLVCQVERDPAAESVFEVGAESKKAAGDTLDQEVEPTRAGRWRPPPYAIDFMVIGQSPDDLAACEYQLFHAYRQAAGAPHRSALHDHAQGLVEPTRSLRLTNPRRDGARGGKISSGDGAPQNVMNDSPPALDRVSSRDVGFRLARVKHWLGRQGPVRLLAVYFQSNASYHATGLAFHALLILFPLVLGLLSLIGYLSRSANLGTAIERVIVQSFPADTQAGLTRTLASLQHSAGALGILAIAGLLWTGTSFFAHLEFALNRIYLCRERSFWRQRLVALPMLASFVAALLIAILVDWATRFIPGLGLASFLLAWMVLALLLLLIYWVVPNRSVSFGESWPGALLAGLLIQALSLAFPLYLQLTHEVNVYGRGFGLFFVLATWLYVVAQAIVLGAVFNRMLLGRIPNIGRSFEV